MSPEQWARVAQLYESALAVDPAARASFVAEQTAGDEALRRELESLLAQDATAVLIDQPILEAAAAVLEPEGALEPGTRLGPYRIDALLGAGGMGQVYRAHDSKLQRDVALKILPDAFVHDPDRMARFTREAQVLASLNHPHIGAIYGREDSGSLHALVLELVEGPTLADRIAKGPLPFDEALPIARQIAEALEAAHELGVIHRDLKPANIKVRDDGTVKVLDFGLAKLTRGDDSMGNAGASPTQALTVLSPAVTSAGVILGTAAYMAPEQAKGRSADKRSDVWAFGCVLYEMLTGRRAFEGEDVSETLAAVLKSDPDWTALPGGVSPAVRTLVEQCLVKDRRRRIADIAVVDFVLTQAAVLDAPAELRASPHRRTSRWRIPAAVAASAAITAALMALSAWALDLFRAERRVARFTFMLPTGQRFPDVSRQVLAVSPDGDHIVYWAGGRLHVKSTSEFESHPIPGVDSLEPVAYPVFSPDGESIAFFAPDRTIRRISRVGGASAAICPVRLAPFGMTWEGNDIVFGQAEDGILRCPANGGKPEQLAAVGKDELAHGAQILAGGEWMIFSIVKRDVEDRTLWDEGKIVAQSLATGERRTIVEGGTGARYVPTGHLLYAVGGVVLAMTLDPKDPRGNKAGTPVVEGVRRAVSYATPGTQFSVSDSGTLVYIPGPAQLSQFSIVFADRSGNTTPLALESDHYVNARISADGTRLAVDTDDGKEANIHTYELSATRGRNRLTFGGRNLFPVWSPDGQRLAFQSDREGDHAIFAQRIDGTGVARLTTAPKGESHIPESWSPDGKHLLFSVLKDGTFTLWTLSLVDGKTARFGEVASQEPIGGVFSPDGGWVAYHSLPAGAVRNDRGSVFVEPFPPTGTRYQAPRLQRDFQPLWSRDGKELFYVRSTAGGQLEAVPVTFKDGVSFGQPKSFPFQVLAGRLSDRPRAFDVLPDGRFVGFVPGSLGPMTPNAELRIVLNWFEELKQRVPLP